MDHKFDDILHGFTTWFCTKLLAELLAIWAGKRIGFLTTLTAPYSALLQEIGR